MTSPVGKIKVKRRTLLYSLYEYRAGEWVDVGAAHFPKDLAVRFYQNRLLNGVFAGVTRELRKVPERCQPTR